MKLRDLLPEAAAGSQLAGIEIVGVTRRQPQGKAGLSVRRNRRRQS